jgi:hypothetical protein
MRNPPLCSLRQLRDGTYSLFDLSLMHEAMDVEEEYAARYREIQEAKDKEK